MNMNEHFLNLQIIQLNTVVMNLQRTEFLVYYFQVFIISKAWNIHRQLRTTKILFAISKGLLQWGLTVQVSGDLILTVERKVSEKSAKILQFYG